MKKPRVQKSVYLQKVNVEKINNFVIDNPAHSFSSVIDMAVTHFFKRFEEGEVNARLMSVNNSMSRLSFYSAATLELLYLFLKTYNIDNTTKNTQQEILEGEKISINFIKEVSKILLDKKYKGFINLYHDHTQTEQM